MDFVVGQPRSGTAFLTHLLNAGGDVVALHQNLQTLTCHKIVAAGFGYYEGRVSADRVRRLVRMYALRPQIRIDSSWLSTWILPVLLEEFPDARFLHIVRDPRDNIRSSYNEHDIYGHLYSNPDAEEAFMRWCVSQNKTWLSPLMENMLVNLPRIKRPDWDKLSAFEKNCAFWNEGHRLILESLSPRKDRYLRVKLEDLRKDEAAAAATIFDFFGVRAPSRERLKRAVTTMVDSKDEPMWAEIRRIKTDLRIDMLPTAYKDWSPQQEATLQRMCGDMARTLGCAL